MAEPRKSFIIQLPKDANFKEIRTKAYEEGIVLMPAHQNHSRDGLKAYKLKGTQSQCDWFNAEFSATDALDS